MAKTKSELRLALAMRGGVSLAVWIGGAVQEIDRLRRNEEGDVLVKLRAHAGFHSVRVDVLSGASAGGLNGAILAAAITRDQPVNDLRGVWMGAASLQDLLYPGGTKARSVLDGEYFRTRLQQVFQKLADATADDQTTMNVDVLLSVTSVAPNTIATVIDRSVTDDRIDGQIRLRSRDAVDLTAHGLGRVPEQVVTPTEYTTAARSTAGFPVAFEPLLVAPADLRGKVEFDPVRPTPLRLYDGGVVDNMPVGKALQAIDDAPADGPTRRYLLYLHPSPGVPDPSKEEKAGQERNLLATRARPIDVAKSAVKALRTKSLAEDLAALDAHNREVDDELRQRAALLLDGGTEVDREQIAAFDASRLVDLLWHPRRHLDHCVPPVDIDPKIDPANASQYRDLAKDLTAAIAAEPDHPGLLPQLASQSSRPWSVPIRIASLLIEWCRAIEGSDPPADVGDRKQELYGVRAYGYHRASQLNRVMVEALGDGPITADALVAARRAPLAEHVAEVVIAWERLCVIAAELRRLDPGDSDVDILITTFRTKISPSCDLAEVSTHLDELDRALLPQHRHAPTGSLDRIDYVTIAGTANTPAADTYRWPEAPSPTPPVPQLFKSLRTVNTVTADQMAGRQALVDPGSKLAGNQLHNFAAFLRAAWRANDWMWGQADAAASLVSLLVDEMPIDTPVDAQDIHALCTDANGLEGDRLDLARKPWLDAAGNPDADLLAAVELELRTEGSDRGLTKGLLLWRRHLEIFGTELLRRKSGDDDNGEGINPSGTDGAATLEAAAAEWDKATRRLSAFWGQRELSALGNRASFVAQKAMFSDVGLKLRAIGISLGLVVSPLVAIALGRRRTLFATLLFLAGVLAPRVAGHGGGRFLVGALAAVICGGGLWVTRRPLAALKGHAPTDDLNKKPLRLWELWALLSIVAAVVAIAVPWVINEVDGLADVRAKGDLYPYVVAGTVVATTLLTWHWAKWYWQIVVAGGAGLLAGGWAWVGANAATVADWCLGPVINAFGSFWFAMLAIAAFTSFLGATVDLADYPQERKQPQ